MKFNHRLHVFENICKASVGSGVNVDVLKAFRYLNN